MDKISVPSNDTWLAHVKLMSSIHCWIIRLIINPLFVLGVIFNVFTFAVFCRLYKRRPTLFHHARRSHIYLMILTIADLCYILLMLEYTGTFWKLPLLESQSNELCAWIFYIRGVFGTWSSLLLTTFSFHRLLSLYKVKRALSFCRPIVMSDGEATNLSYNNNNNNQLHENRRCIEKVCLAKLSSGEEVDTNFSGHDTVAHENFYSPEIIKEIPERQHQSTYALLKEYCFRMYESVWFAIVVTLLLSMMFTLPRLASFRLSNSRIHVACRSNTEEKALSTVLHMTFHIAVQRLGPAVLIILANVCMMHGLKQVKQLASSVHSHCHLYTETKLTQMCIVLGCVYCVLFLPPSIHWSIIYYWELMDKRSQPTANFIEFHSLIGDLESVTAALNHSVNFVVYYFALNYFKTQVHEIFTRHCWCPVLAQPREGIAEETEDDHEGDEEVLSYCTTQPLHHTATDKV